MNKLLVTSAIEKTWGKEQEIIFLGEWCKLYPRRHIWLKRNFSTISNLWTDKNKMDRDEIYLKDLYERFLTALSSELNKIHESNYSVRYWRIVIGPFLFAYIPIIFERWETLRNFFEGSNQTVDVIDLNSNSKKNLFPNIFTRDFIQRGVNSDFWNLKLFSKIIKYKYHTKVNILNLHNNFQNNYIHQMDWKHSLKDDLKKMIKFYIKKIEQLLSPQIVKYNKIIFDEGYMSYLDYIKFCLQLKLIPTSAANYLSNENLKIKNYSENKNDLRSSSMNFQFDSKNDFEEFLKKNIVEELPEIFLEKYYLAVQEVKKFTKIKSKIIFSNTNIFNNDVYKIWVAKMCENGSKLIINGHGGFLPEKYKNFGHENKISDKFITWYKPLNSKEIQLTPLKLVNRSIAKKKKKEKCLIVGLECTRYSGRIASIPVVEDNLSEFNNLTNFIKLLDPKPYQSLSYRNAGNLGWFFTRRFEDLHGREKLSKKNFNIYEDFSSSKLVVCNYPSTPFLESINLKIPTILFYSKNIWREKKEFSNVLDDMKKAKLYFDNYELAAAHINNIWDDINVWWNQPMVQDTIKKCLDQTCNVKSEWIKEYDDFFKSINQ